MSEPKWFLPNEQTLRAEGPFGTEDILQKLSQHEIDYQDFIWSGDLPQKRWYRIYELDVFHKLMKPTPVTFLPEAVGKEKIQFKADSKVFANRDGEYGVENQYRRFPRAPLQAEAIIHDSTEIAFSQVIDISERGMSVRIIDEVPFEKGGEISVTVRPTSVLPAFNCRGVFIHMRPQEGHVQAGIYFLALNPNVRHQIAKYIIDQLQLALHEKKAL